ncbi:FAD-dependent oxidoreductase [Kitasatospora sp. NPDC059327]|uniref:FAD-dependent oxidoreductase n=1 Tax=Kitasatospora sp. NPDC059327 TaxID=3346803 RepID=UPI0036CBF85C
MISRRTMLRAGGGLALAGASALTVGAASSPVWGASTREWSRLRRRLTGNVVLPSDPGYDLAKQLQISAYDSINPQAIVYAKNAQDVRATIEFAQYNDIPMRTRSGGHNFSGWSTGEGVVLDVSSLNQAVVTGNTVHVGPGAKAIDYLMALSPYNKQTVAGTCPTVCPGGFLSGGGVGFQTRKFGMGSDRMVSAKVVLADGRIVTTSETEEPALFWGLRGGGGGNFGVVVDFEVRPIDAPRQTYFSTVWSWDKAAVLFEAWQDSLISGSRSLGSSFVYGQIPDTGQGNAPFVVLTGCYQGPQAELETILAGFEAAAGARPLYRVVQEGTFDEAQKNAYICGNLSQDQCHRVGQTPGGTLARTPWQSESYRFVNRKLTAGEIGDLMTGFLSDPRPTHRRFLHCIGLGGAVADLGRADTAFVHRDALFVTGFATELDKPDPENISAATRWARNGGTVLDRMSSGAYVNFPSTTLDNWKDAYYRENYADLLGVKFWYDPSNFFRHPRSIGS